MKTRIESQPGPGIHDPTGSGGIESEPPTTIDARNVSVFYGSFLAVRDISITMPEEPHHRDDRPIGVRQVDLPAVPQPDERHDPRRPRRGRVLFRRRRHLRPRRRSGRGAPPHRHGLPAAEPVPQDRIFDNVAFGTPPRRGALKGELHERVEQALRPRGSVGRGQGPAARRPAVALSGGQQQRLCIARAIAVEPDVILMDEPASALDPASTLRIEELMIELRSEYTIVIVTHNMQQAARVSDWTLFILLGRGRGVRRRPRRSSRTRRTAERRTT